MKRKTEETHQSNGHHEAKKRVVSGDAVISRFRDGLFDPAELEKYTKSYAASGPYKHGVISPLIAPDLLRSVRNEIEQNLSFTEKETDIYKIFQSGDLANLDGLDDASLSRLPSLLQLRDALYSAKFRAYLSSLTGSGELSGKKTDMAINVYTEGCHLLCHDDVIGSRRVSYILYLTDPDTPWQAEWGGALRLYPTTTVKDDNGQDIKIPSPDFTLSIPPAFNQLSFFTVQPGESFHDVEEVYHPSEQDKGKQKRVRMAISGWFHIPQEGEEGYEPGLEERLAERSSLSQLQGRNGDAYDRPQPQPINWDAEPAQPDSGKGKGKGKQAVQTEDAEELTEADLDFLLQFLAPSYLTPDIAEELSEAFSNDSSLSLEKVLSEKFAARVREYIERQEKKELPSSSDEIESSTNWKVARPPHKHRYLFQQPQNITSSDSEANPIEELLTKYLPSQAFRKWLTLITGADRLTDHNLLVRRFRRGQDYTLANSYEGEEPRLEFTIGLTATPGWEKADVNNEEDEDLEEKEVTKNGKDGSTEADESDGKEKEEPSVGGYEIYMSGDDDEDAGDAAIYKAAHGDDDGILFSMAAGWNRMSIVLRDSGTLKFVKYVSAAARGDRWDITGEVGVVFADDQEEEEGE
ncbi:oxidoreductase, putative [Talaromyces stipitatus ATCC 10500]|uniref:uS12 prolyl 3,4-dihydroxylase n=1 Tax=Talaromyces stipitatus (strain ATCC 10500 / CBS 375.48 / QM 6759 / NRRL 1006) TaxID=441959 RepID=B8MRT7_TALSN|nr:oxidoreductase, putative [Talaromyces stipitatus ATCC 10500]EED13271.1 oxidoreductase, putative [Talaromyces stipitatus ATCC 10500]